MCWQLMANVTRQTLQLPPESNTWRNGTCISFCNQPKVHFGLTWDNCAKCHMDEAMKRIQCLSNASQHVHNYLQPFMSFCEILVRNCNFFLSLHLTPPLGVFPLEFWEKSGPQKTRIMGLPGSEDILTIGWAVSTQYQHVTDRLYQ